ncbi:lysophospholipid acyltransferase family protein [Poriferisphaera sp. WC338]|uniref:lysophospholipid acyltransferase family protein n=1 Tax=Poriferisphaera sp. WC338 TaxID=3425129 RepID=UPI003D81B44B
MQWQYQTARDHGVSGFERMKSSRREMGLIGAVTCRMWGLMIAAYLKLMHQIEVIDGEYLPRNGPFVIIANHTSHLDALALGSILRKTSRDRVFSIAAEDLFFKNGVRGTASAMLINALPMRRGRMGKYAMEDLRQRLTNDKVGYVIFPEGTRSRDGELGKFKAGIGMLVCDTDVPITPCWIDGAWKAWPSAKRFPKRGKVVIKVGKPERATSFPHDINGWRVCAETLRERVLEAKNVST